jgi:hypothetical protein
MPAAEETGMSGVDDADATTGPRGPAAGDESVVEGRITEELAGLAQPRWVAGDGWTHRPSNYQ